MSLRYTLLAFLTLVVGTFSCDGPTQPPAGPKVKLAFVVQPSAVAGGQPINPAGRSPCKTLSGIRSPQRRTP